MPFRNETEEHQYRNPSTLHPFLQGQSSELLTISELAAILKVPRSWIYAHTRSNSRTRLPYIKIGKYLRFYEAEVREYLQELKSEQ
jgi:excisionase family DNA binding protein